MKEMKQLEDLCAAVARPDPQRLAMARAKVVAAIAEGRTPGGPRTWLPTWPAKLRQGWLSLAAPLAAAAAVAAIIVGTQTVVNAVHGHPAPRSHGPATGAGRSAEAPPPHPVTAYVASGGGPEVTPILTAINRALPEVAVGGAIGGNIMMAPIFSPDASTAYVLSDPLTSGKPGAVTPILTATNKALKPIKVGQDPRFFAITPDGKTIYVSSHGSDSVTPIDTATDKALTPIRVGGPAGSIAITPDGRTAYVATGSGTVTPIQTATNKALPPIRVGYGPYLIVITPDGATAYVQDASEITPIRTATNTALAPIKVSASNMEITPDGATLYALNLGTNNNPEVFPIRTATNTVLTPISVGKSFAEWLGIGITPDGRTAYVVNTRAGTVVPIRTASNTALAPIKVGRYPESIAITRDGRTAYVTDSAPGRPGEVTPIRVSSNTALRPIRVTSFPETIAITPR